jgi:hypothetical protein
MKSINLLKIVESCGVNLSELRKSGPDDKEQASQYFSYMINSQQALRVNVESTAKSVMEEVLRFPLHIQNALFAAIVREITQPGEQAVIEGDKKRRGARAVRLASEAADVAEILLTH